MSISAKVTIALRCDWILESRELCSNVEDTTFSVVFSGEGEEASASFPDWRIAGHKAFCPIHKRVISDNGEFGFSDILSQMFGANGNRFQIPFSIDTEKKIAPGVESEGVTPEGVNKS